MKKVDTGPRALDSYALWYDSAMLVCEEVVRTSLADNPHQRSFGELYHFVQKWLLVIDRNRNMQKPYA